MADTPSRVATLLEIAALQAVHGAEEAVIDAAEVQQLVDAACEGALEEEVAAAQLGSSSIDLTIHVTAAAPPPLQASLRVRLPAAYPGAGGGCSGLQAGSDPVTAGAAAVAVAAAAICSVGPPTQMACGGAAGAAAPGARGWCDSCTTQMAALASSAAQEGRPCLHELVEAVQAALSDLGRQLLQQQGQQGQQEETSAAAAAAGAWGDGGADADEVLLVKLDHMHNRGMYCRTLAAWVKELGLTGRLVFGPSGLLLELLTGPPARLRAYLVRHRTEAVDVDSRGRKCKERMMEVIGQRACGNGPSSSNSGGGCGQRAFTDYREVQLSSLDEVAQLLEAAGVGDWLRPAVGLPPVAATR